MKKNEDWDLTLPPPPAWMPERLGPEETALFQAAPDLLAQLGELVEIVEAAIAAKDWKVDGCCDPSLTLDRAHAALAKAKGGAA